MGRSKAWRRGLAERWLAQKRGGRIEMKIAFDGPMIGLMNAMFRINRVLPLMDAGNGPQAPLQVYKAPDETAQRQLVAIQKFLEAKFLKKRPPREGEGKKPVLDFIELEDDETITVGIAKTYVNRIKEVMKHYEKVGQLVGWVEPWLKLKDALDGKTFEVDDDVESVEDDAEDDAQDEVKTEAPGAAAS